MNLHQMEGKPRFTEKSFCFSPFFFHYNGPVENPQRVFKIFFITGAFVMNRYGIQFQVKNSPSLDPEFMPILKFNRAFLQSAKKPVSFAVERSNGQVAVCNTFIHGTPDMREADHYYADRLVKSMLWLQGGFKVYVSGDEDVYNYLRRPSPSPASAL